MTHLTPLSDRQEENNFDINLEDTTGIGERFLQGFNEFVEQEKQSVIKQVVQEEFPQFVNDDIFLDRVSKRLGTECIKDKRFVFLVFNPKLKQ